MNNKIEKPTLSGTRLKTRKRDEKEKYDPKSFRDAIIQGLNETQGDLEKVSKFLDVSGSRLNYRLYAEVLFDILFAGGILAPGGFLVVDADHTKPSTTDVCLFNCLSVTDFYQVFYKLIRRYKYLEKTFEEEVRKVLVFQKGFRAEQREKLATVTGQILAHSLASPRLLDALFQPHLVKDGLSLECAATVFAEWLKEKDVREVFSALKKVHMDSRLEELLASNKRSSQALCDYLQERGLSAMADQYRALQAALAKKQAQNTLSRMMDEQRPISEMVEFTKDLVSTQGMTETEVAIAVWNTIMRGVEWNKKEDLVVDHALKHLCVYTPLLAAALTSTRPQLALMLRVQDYCYDNMTLIKAFHKIILLLYNRDVLGEDVILRWYRQAHSNKGKTVFLEQMTDFVDWLVNAEEESDEE